MGADGARAKLALLPGKTIYLISKNLLGRETIERVVIKAQYESGYTDKIESVNRFTESIELASHRNLRLNEGTIVIKNGRLQDRYAISPGDDVYIVADATDVIKCQYNQYLQYGHKPLGLSQHFPTAADWTKYLMIGLAG